jgi:hypothetical protein
MVRRQLSQRRRRLDRRRSGREYLQCHTLKVSHRGASGLERVHKGRGSSPRVSSSSHNSSYSAQAGVSSQSRQKHLLHLVGLVLRLVEDTHIADSETEESSS